MSEDVDSVDKMEKHASEEEMEKEAKSNSSEEDSEGGEEAENEEGGDEMDIWRSNAQYLYDLLLHHHTQWPCLSCNWGPISDDYEIGPTIPISQILYTTTHTDGVYNDNEKRWKRTPEMITTTLVDFSRKRGTLPWQIGKYNETQRNRHFAHLKSIIHPGLISRIQSIPHTMWLLSHSNKKAVYLWKTGNRGSRSTSNSYKSTIPDITLYVSDNDILDDYPLSVFCSAVSSNNQEQIMRLNNISREEDKTHVTPELRAESDAQRERRRQREQQRKEKERKEKEKKDYRRIRDRLKRHQARRDAENKKRQVAGEELLPALTLLDVMTKDECVRLSRMLVEAGLKKEEEVKEEEVKEEEVKGVKEEEVKEEEMKEEEMKENVAMPEEGQEKMEVEDNPVEEAIPSTATTTATTTTENINVPLSAPLSESTSADCVVLATARNHLHLWALPRLDAVPFGCHSRVIDLSSCLPSLEIQDAAFAEGFDREGKTIVVAARQGVVLVIDSVSQKVLCKMEHAHEDDVHCVLNLSTHHANADALTDNLSNYLITGGADKKVNVWDLRQLIQSQSHQNEGEEEKKTKKEELCKPLITLDVDDVVLCMDFCPQNPRYLAVGTASGEIDLFDLLAKGAEEYLVLRHLGHRSAVVDLHFNPEDEMTIVSASDDSSSNGGGTVQIWRPHEFVLLNAYLEDGQPSPLLNEYVHLYNKKKKSLKKKASSKLFD